MGDHFRRIVYFRLSEKIKKAMRLREALPERAKTWGVARWFGSRPRGNGSVSVAGAEIG